jgi:uncharacterized protein YjeT (DUF2065 family)
LIASAGPMTTLWLSVLLGAYLVAGGIVALTRGELWPEMLAEIGGSPAILAIAGAFACGIGALIVSIHNVWTDAAAIMVSAAGWIALAEGLVLLARPELWLRLARALIASRAWGVSTLLVGAFLLSSALVRPINPAL